MSRGPRSPRVLERTDGALGDGLSAGLSPVANRGSRRVVVFAAVCVAAIAVSVGYTLFVVANRSTPRVVVGAPPADLAAVTSKPHVVFENTANAAGFGQVAVVPLDALGGPSRLTGLVCDRVDFAAGRGLCLQKKRGSLIVKFQAVIFDAQFTPLHHLSLAGIPSRTRVSPDGHYGAVTTFVRGDSYAADTFSTRTNFIDLQAGHVIGDLEHFTLLRDGKRLQRIDMNFWGVTFASDSGHFFATVGTGGHHYLVEGQIATRQVHVVRDGVECPAISPDNRLVAFKRRVTGGLGPVTWRLYVLDLSTGREWPLAETRNVDDQAQWLDSQHVLYGVPVEGPGAVTDTWVAPADGTGTPTRFLASAWSPAVVNG